MLQKEDWVLYKGEKYRVIHVYENTGFCEIKKHPYFIVELVNSAELKKIAKRKYKST